MRRLVGAGKGVAVRQLMRDSRGVAPRWGARDYWWHVNPARWAGLRNCPPLARGAALEDLSEMCTRLQVIRRRKIEGQVIYLHIPRVLSEKPVRARTEKPPCFPAGKMEYGTQLARCVRHDSVNASHSANLFPIRHRGARREAHCEWPLSGTDPFTQLKEPCSSTSTDYSASSASWPR